MKLGRIHSRSLDGPVRLPSGPLDMMKRVEQGYVAFFNIFNIVMIPRLIRQPKWFKTSRDLKPGDFVYFKKEESEFASKWMIGQVDSVTRSKDGFIQRASIRYHNANEENPRITERAVRSLVKLFHIDDNGFQEDMAMVERLVSDLNDEVDKNDAGKQDDERLKANGIGTNCCFAHDRYVTNSRANITVSTNHSE